MFVEVVSTGGQAAVTVVGHGNDVGDAFGDDKDFVIVLDSSGESPNAEIDDVIVADSAAVHQGFAANTAVLSNVTTDGDIMMLVSDGGNSKEFLFANGDTADLQLGHGMATMTLKTASGDLTLNPGGDIQISGTIATGTWQGTDIGVAYGGTGVSTLTANGVLIGNGTSAIGAIDMSTKGHVLIGDGSGNPQMLGVGTDTHVLTADSGETTGVKWAASVTQATQAEAEAENNVDKYLPPDLLHFGPWAAKAWVKFDGTSSDPITNDASYNCDATTDVGTGNYRVNWTTDFSSADYSTVALTGNFHSVNGAIAAGSIDVASYDGSHSAADTNRCFAAAFGDQ
jgi:hypothetical protein